MNMHSIAWWPILALLVIATVVDIHSRRIPNWLVLPFLAAGVIVNTASYGVKGLGQSMGGIALAAAVTGVLCWLRGMGMGDLKLCAAVGAWIGPAQLGIALVGNGHRGRRAGADLGGVPRMAARIAGWIGRSRLGVLDEGRSSPSKPGSR